MARLLEELTARGELTAVALKWAQEHQAECGGTTDSVLLDLDLIDEEALLRALESRFGVTAARPSDLLHVDPEVAKLAPPNLSRSFSMCPLRLVGKELVALVQSPLPAKWLAELQSLGVRVRQLVAPAHYLAVARGRVYAAPIDEPTERLEARLARRRDADIRRVLGSVEAAATLASAFNEALNFAACLLQFPCFLSCRENEMRVSAAGGGRQAPRGPLPVPDIGCTLGAAIRYGGYFMGPLTQAGADRAFYQALGRPVPRWAFVAPVLVAQNRTVVLYADNGPRGIATRWVAELTLLSARLGQRAGRSAGAKTRPEPPRAEATAEAAATEPEEELPAASMQIDTQAWLDDLDATSEVAPEEAPEPPESAPPPPSVQPESAPPPPSVQPGSALPPPDVQPPAAETAPAITATEQSVLDRLREAAAEEGMELDAFIDGVLEKPDAPPAPEPAPDATAAMAGEVKELFEKLASDIPKQLAQGMATAFRDLVPRLAPPPTSFPTAPAAAPPSAAGPPPAASVELVQKEAAPREVADYRSRRRKTTRVKL